MSGGFKYIESKRVSKAQKRRDAKAAKKVEQQKRIEEGEKLDEHKERSIETDRLEKLLDHQGLKIHQIDADGDCLYKAVEHQLSLASDTDDRLSFQDLRERTSQYMLANSEDFLPFLLNDQGELMGDEEFTRYCNRIARTKEWGGHLELTAIAQITRKSIHIYQADNKNPIKIEPRCHSDKSPISLSFHKHLYRLGEHYNSVVAKPNEE